MLLNFSSPLVGVAAVALRTPALPGSADPTTCLLPHKEGHGHQRYRYRRLGHISRGSGLGFCGFGSVCSCRECLSLNGGEGGGPGGPFQPWLFRDALSELLCDCSQVGFEMLLESQV